jgi:hypothetical protein
LGVLGLHLFVLDLEPTSQQGETDDSVEWDFQARYCERRQAKLQAVQFQQLSFGCLPLPSSIYFIYQANRCRENNSCGLVAGCQLPGVSEPSPRAKKAKDSRSKQQSHDEFPSFDLAFSCALLD